MKKIYATVSMISTFVFSTVLQAQWSNDPDNPLVICDAAGNQTQPAFIRDGTSGFFVFWMDGRDGHTAIYGQHIDQHGNALWEANGKSIVDYTDHDAQLPKAVLNSEGNILLTWEHFVYGSYPDTLYVMKLDPDGDWLWDQPVAAGGNDLSTGGAYWGPVALDIVQNGNGCYIGAVMTGYGYNFLTRMKVNGDGSLPWDYNGYGFEGITNAGSVRLMSDNAGGAYLTWEYVSAFTQRFNSDGDLLWGDFVSMSGCTGEGGTYAGFPYYLELPDGEDGITAVWSSTSRDIYASRINDNGEFLWDGDCVPIYEDANIQEQVSFSKSGDDYYVGWMDSRPEAPGIYMQKFNNDGETGWASPVYVEDTSFYIPVIKSVATSEGDNVIFYQAGASFFAQKIHPDGSMEWPNALKLLGDYYQPFYGAYQIIATDDNNVIGVAETGGNAGDQQILAFNLKYASGDTLTEDTSTTFISGGENLWMSVMPNPADNWIEVSLHNNESSSAIISNLAGEIMISQTISGNERIDISDLPAGIYFIRINDSVGRFIKQ